MGRAGGGDNNRVHGIQQHGSYVSHTPTHAHSHSDGVIVYKGENNYT